MHCGRCVRSCNPCCVSTCCSPSRWRFFSPLSHHTDGTLGLRTYLIWCLPLRYRTSSPHPEFSTVAPDRSGPCRLSSKEDLPQRVHDSIQHLDMAAFAWTPAVCVVLFTQQWILANGLLSSSKLSIHSGLGADSWQFLTSTRPRVVKLLGENICPRHSLSIITNTMPRESPVPHTPHPKHTQKPQRRSDQTEFPPSDVFGDAPVKIKKQIPGIVIVGRIFLQSQPQDGDPKLRYV